MAIPIRDLLAMQRRQALRLNSQIVDEELTKVLRQAATDAREMAREVSSIPGVGSSTRAAQLRLAANGAEDIAEKLWFNTGEMTREGIFRAADLAAYQSLDVDKVMGMPISFVKGYQEGILASARISAESIIQRRQFGYTLSQRVLRNERLTAGRITRVIESALVNNLSARELAKRVGQFIDPKTPGGASYAAKRLARTEINNAHHWVSRDQMSNRPWINGVEWNLSGSHPRTDACDELAANGPYPKDDVPDKPHPQCLCFITPDLPDEEEFLDSLLGGEYNDWLEETGRERIVCNSSCKVITNGGEQYQRLDTNPEQEEWLGTSFSEIEADLTSEELEVLDDYLVDSTITNRVLRGDIDDRWSDETIGRAAIDAARLSRVVQKSSIPENVIAYRGVSKEASEVILKGKRFTDPGFSSTSLEQQIGEIFSEGYGGGGYVLEIQIPEGTKGLAIPGRLAFDAGMSPEQEILLDKGTTFEISAVDHIARKILAKVVS